MTKLDAKSISPLYQQLHDIILKQVQEDKYEVGDKIPSEEQIMEMYEVSRVTVRNAIKLLVEENVLVKKHGKGTFVAMPVYVESMSAGGSFTESGLQMKKIPTTQIISVTRESARKTVSRFLGIKEGTEIIQIKRLRLLDNEPAIYEIDSFRTDCKFLEKIQLANSSLINILKNYGLHPTYFDNIIEIALADDSLSELLKVDHEEPLVKINQTVLDTNNEIIYFNEQFVKSDVYKVTIRSHNN